MKNIKKFSLMVAFLGILTIPIFTSAATVEELQSIINQLLAKLQILQQQLNTIKNTTNTTFIPTSWCHNFNINLRINNKRPEVSALQTALEKEGFTINQNEKDNLFFGESTAAAVVSFQEKYKDEILTPFGLTKGTGYVGPSTRNKLNSLYGCGKSPTPYCAQVITPAQNPLTGECREFSTPCEVPANWNKVASCNTTSDPSTTSSISTSTPNSTSSVSFIKVISPNGGEKWLSNTKQSIQIQSNVVNKRICLYLVRFSTYLQSIGCVSNSNNSILTYEWFVPSNLTTGYGYKISAITTDDNGKTLSDQSDYSFSIISSSTSFNTTITTTTNISNINTTSTTSSAVLLENATPVEIYSIQNLPIKESWDKQIGYRYAYLDTLYDNNNNIYVASTEVKMVDQYIGSDWLHKSYPIVRFFKSSDGGKTWVEKGKIFEPNKSDSWPWAKIKKTGNILYVIVGGTGANPNGMVFSSFDDGTTWQAINLPPNVFGFGANGQRRGFDFLALDNRNFIIAYNTYNEQQSSQYDYDFIVAKTSDGGATWNTQIKRKGDFDDQRHFDSVSSYRFPQLQLLPNGNIGLLYYAYALSDASKNRALMYRESSDKGLTWSNPQMVAQGYSGSYTGQSDPSDFIRTIVRPNHFLFSSGNKKIVGYTIEEQDGPEPVADVPALSESTGSSWTNRHIKTVDGLTLSNFDEDIFFSFAVSPNGKYMGFLGLGKLVQDGSYVNSKLAFSDQKDPYVGIFLIYSSDSGNTWKHKKITQLSASSSTPAFSTDGAFERFPEFSITDNGEVLVAYPWVASWTRYSSQSNGVYSVKFLRGIIE
jgi:hypothetical protein